MYDELTGQHYLRARYYAPVLGRFIQEDVYQGAGLNLYAYCWNNPVVYYDPSGFVSDSLLPNELQFGTYTDLKDTFGLTSTTGLTPHHMVSAEYMERNYGVRKEDGLAMMLETTYCNSGGRHGKTATYGGITSGYYDLTPRQALSHDLFDIRKLLIDNGLYDNYAKKQLIAYSKKQQEIEYSTNKKNSKYSGKVIENKKIFSKEYEDNLKEEIKGSVCKKVK